MYERSEDARRGRSRSDSADGLVVALWLHLLMGMALAAEGEPDRAQAARRRRPPRWRRSSAARRSKRSWPPERAYVSQWTDPAAAQRHFGEGVASARIADNQFLLALCLRNLSRILAERGAVAESIPTFREAITVAAAARKPLPPLDDLPVPGRSPDACRAPRRRGLAARRPGSRRPPPHGRTRRPCAAPPRAQRVTDAIGARRMSAVLERDTFESDAEAVRFALVAIDGLDGLDGPPTPE